LDAWPFFAHKKMMFARCTAASSCCMSEAAGPRMVGSRLKLVPCGSCGLRAPRPRCAFLCEQCIRILTAHLTAARSHGRRSDVQSMTRRTPQAMTYLPFLVQVSQLLVFLRVGHNSGLPLVTQLLQLGSLHRWAVAGRRLQAAQQTDRPAPQKKPKEPSTFPGLQVCLHVCLSARLSVCLPLSLLLAGPRSPCLRVCTHLPDWPPQPSTCACALSVPTLASPC
jgi:hypothetical protein